MLETTAIEAKEGITQYLTMRCFREIRTYTQSQSNLKHLKIKGFKYAGMADFLLQHGRWYDPAPSVADEHSVQGACFRNAALATVMNNWRYVEGFSFVIIPAHHGWCVDSAGGVKEVTWKKSGAAYFGVEFTIEQVIASGGSVLDSPKRNLDIYRHRFKG